MKKKCMQLPYLILDDVFIKKIFENTRVHASRKMNQKCIQEKR